jgi:2-aminoethylphosphonate-pyruvate transaminase
MTTRPSDDETPDKLLFTPGPLTTSLTVKQAMLHDLGSRDVGFIRVVREVRSALVRLAHADAAEYAAIPVQGSGTFAVESVISSVIPDSGKLLVLANGAYGRRIAQIARAQRIPHQLVSLGEPETVTAAHARAALEADPAITHVAVVHSETTTGLVNPVAEIGAVVKAAGKVFIVDAMSSFGGIPLDVPGAGIDFLVSSANKCIEGVPGFGFAIARRSTLVASAGSARTLSLDLHAQLAGLEQNGQFRFTPPTHALLAFHTALAELEAEGGVAGRAHRYRTNAETLWAGMARLGFEPYLPDGERGPIISSYYCPKHPAWRFEDFYGRLSDRGFVIYPGKVSDADCFRIGTIGRLYPHHIEALLEAIAAVLTESGISLPPRA